MEAVVPATLEPARFIVSKNGSLAAEELLGTFAKIASLLTAPLTIPFVTSSPKVSQL